MEGETTSTASSPVMPAANESKAGFNAMIIVVILTVVVLASAGWIMMKDTDMPMDDMMTPTAGGMMNGGEMMIEQDAPTQELKVQGTSDEVTAIEADLNATNLDSLKDINQI